MRSPFSKIKDEITDYFESLGYKTTWDCNTRQGIEWYEILEDNHLVCQIDIGVPLADLIEDMLCWEQDKEGTSKSNNTVCHEKSDPRWKELLKRVTESQKKTKR